MFLKLWEKKEVLWKHSLHEKYRNLTFKGAVYQCVREDATQFTLPWAWPDLYFPFFLKFEKLAQSRLNMYEQKQFFHYTEITTKAKSTKLNHITTNHSTNQNPSTHLRACRGTADIGWCPGAGYTWCPPSVLGWGPWGGGGGRSSSCGSSWCRSTSPAHLDDRCSPLLHSHTQTRDGEGN